jgi:hypothetical protein
VSALSFVVQASKSKAALFISRSKTPWAKSTTFSPRSVIERKIADRAEGEKLILAKFAPETDEQLWQYFRAPEQRDPIAKIAPPNRGLSIRSDMELAVLQQARGAPPTVVREVYREIAATWESVIAAMDFSLTYPSGARVRPLNIEFHNYVLFATALCGDRDLARRIARAYPIDPVDGQTPQFRLRTAILHMLLADEDDLARNAIEFLSDGYPIDFPPERIELPLGVVRRDASLIFDAMKAIKTRFNGKWTPKKYEAYHARRVADYKRKPRGPAPTWEESLQKVGKELISFGWGLSVWSLAFLNIAHWRGMTLDNERAYSEWVPLALSK